MDADRGVVDGETSVGAGFYGGVMFDPQVFASLVTAVEDACAAPAGVATNAQLASALISLRSAADRIDGLEAGLLHRFEVAGGATEQGASSTAAWARQHLRLDGRQSRASVRAGRTLTQLPQVAEASRAGTVRLDHVKEFTAGVTKAGLDVIVDAQDYLVPVAQTCTPGELRDVIGQLVEVVHPDRLDEQWARGMDKNDFTLARVGDGYVPGGFVDIVTGAQLKTWLDAASAPRGPDDERPASQRRVDAVRELIASQLEHGMATDRGVRPQLHVSVELDALLGGPLGAPAVLSGFGPIGPELLGYLHCVSDVTPVLVDGQTSGATPQANVLNVGRSRRLATPRQRVAVRTRQDGVCANPGCRNTHLEVHHVSWWDRDGGETDLDNLVGLCPRCHHLVHQQQLHVAVDGHGGFGFSTGQRDPRADHWRQHRARIRRYLRSLRKAAAGEPGPNPSQMPAPSPIDRGWPSTSLTENKLRLTLVTHPLVRRRRQ